MVDGWTLTGNYISFYELAEDKNVRHNGKNAIKVKSIKASTLGFGATYKSTKDESYAGKRIRLSGFLKTEEVKDWAGLWIRVEEKMNYKYMGSADRQCMEVQNLQPKVEDTINEPLPPKQPATLAFDNMYDCGGNNRSIKGTTDWKKYEVVVDVPANSGNIYYGALLSAGGTLWLDDLKIEVVDQSVPITGCKEESLASK